MQQYSVSEQSLLGTAQAVLLTKVQLATSFATENPPVAVADAYAEELAEEFAWLTATALQPP